MKKIYIFGHRKPDTDSVTSAIALSYLKNMQGVSSIPKVLGSINNETKFVLDYFNIKVPSYLYDVKLQIKDLKYYTNCYINECESIKNTYDYMTNKSITGVPIVDNNHYFKGLITSKIIGNELINGDFTKINTSYNNILDVLNGEEVVKVSDEIKGEIIAAAYKSTTIINDVEFNKNTILIVGDRHSVIEDAVKCGIKLLIIVGNKEIKEEHILLARQNNVNIIKTPYDTFHTSKLINLSNYIKNLLSDTRNISFKEDDYYDDFKKICEKLGYNNYPVIDSKGKCLGLIRITDINLLNKKQVILVDHNEVSQSVDGLDEAEILEIIDHHKLGSITTNMPINFRNMTVGSTNTIIYSMYNEANVEIPSDIAGLMLSGILSDTLKFTSPTTTEYDKYVAMRLSEIANINIDEYSNKMFKAGTNFSGKSIREIIDGDIKTFECNGKTFLVSQVLSMNSEEILNRKDEYISELNKIVSDKEIDFIILGVTDILKKGSYIFFNESAKDIVSSSFNIDDIKEGYFVKDCLSRKKQIVPKIMDYLN